jgi:hypothetical protein
VSGLTARRLSMAATLLSGPIWLQGCSLTPANPIAAPAGPVTALDPAAPLPEPLAAPAQRAGQGVLTLPSPPGYPGETTVVQDLHAVRGDESYAAQAVLRVSAERVVLVLTLPLGPRIATIDWTAGGVEVTRNLELPMAELVAPEDVLADVVLAFWPDAALRRNLRDSTLALAVDPDGRRVMQGGVPVIVVRHDPGDPWNGRTTLDNRLLGYRLTIFSRTVSGV